MAGQRERTTVSANPDSFTAVKVAALAADEMKAEDIIAFDVSQPLAITDAFVLATGSSPRQVLAIAENMERRLYEKLGLRAVRREGLDEASWVLIDYGDFVLHVFDERSRGFYRLDDLWGDCPRIGLDLPSPEEARQRLGVTENRPVGGPSDAAEVAAAAAQKSSSRQEADLAQEDDSPAQNGEDDQGDQEDPADE